MKHLPEPSYDLLDPNLVLGAYAVGVFPMADARDAAGVYWVEPLKRAVLPLDRFHLSRSLRKAIAADRFRVTADAAFEDVIALCAESADDRPDTWINTTIESAFTTLPLSRVRAFDRNAGKTANWSAGSTAWRWAAHSSANRWSAARPTRRRSRLPGSSRG